MAKKQRSSCQTEGHNTQEIAERNDVISSSDHRLEMLKAFDETKAGVKGLVDSGIHKVPSIFVRPSEELAKDYPLESTNQVHEVPLIDLSDVMDPEKRKLIVDQVRNAAVTWGFFQVVGHGIPVGVLDGMIEGVRMFNEQDLEEKKKFYSRDVKRTVVFNSSYDLFTANTASWRDTLTLSFDPPPLDHELPLQCRESSMEYSKHIKILGNTLLGILSETLGLGTNHLQDMECSFGHRLYGHYYPPCPQPELTMGAAKHSDIGFITILLQSQNMSSLQVLYKGHWVDIHPVRGALVVNIGDLLQLVSNGRFRSVEHRAISNCIGPRISVACFFSGPMDANKVYGPIEELVSEENPPIYRKVKLGEYRGKFLSSSLDFYRALDYYKL